MSGLMHVVIGGRERWALSPREAMELTGIGRTTFYRYVTEGLIEATQIEGQLLIHAEPLARTLGVESVLMTNADQVVAPRPFARPRLGRPRTKTAKNRAQTGVAA